MKKAYEAGDMDVKPNVVNYNSVINAWGRCKAPGSAERASQILYSMENEGVEPDALSYSLVVSAWAHSSNSNATKQAEVVLGEMEDWAREKNKAIDDAFDHRLSTQDQCYSYDGDGPVGNPPSSLPAIRVHLDVECYNTVLIALSRRQEPGAPDRALAILHRMQKLADNEGFETVRPNAKSWNSVLNAMSREKNADSTRRAEQLLNDMTEAGVRPDVFSYAALLHAYQKNASSYSAQRADKIVRTMEQLYQDGELAQAPDVYHYTIVCACWARSGDSIAARRCSEILHHMEKRVQLGFSSCRPNVRTMNAVIDAYARGHHVDEAEQLLDDMISRYRAGDKNVKPDGFTFNAVINCWTRSRRRGCGHKAEMILKRLLKFHEEGNPDVRPDSRSFSHIIDYYSRSREPDAGKKATFLLEGMIKMYDNGYTEVLPTIFTFAAVISAHCKSKDKNAGIHAEHVLQMLKDMNRKHSKLALTTNTFIMNTVLHAWSKSGHPSACYRVEEYLREMERKHKIGNMNLKPNTRTYGLVLATWAKSTVPDKTKRAFQVFEQMRLESKTNANVEMNIHCYNAVINAAAFTEGDYEHRNESFQIATKMMDELFSPDGIQPISSTFGTYLKACGKLSLPRNVVEPAIRRAFTKCIEYGLVNDFVLTQVRYSASTEQYENLLGDLITKGKIDERIKMSDIPEEWHKNVSDSYNSYDDDFRGELWQDNS
jgi:pentatricopeptide repeat protein